MGIRNEYEKDGVDGYYEKNAETYVNPHFSIIKELLESLDVKDKRVLDLCCGTGEVTRCITGAKEIVGLDPYTYKPYKEKTGKRCYILDFKDIAQGVISEHFDIIICSFALHLCEEAMLPNVLWCLSQCSPRLVILTPHKRPDCSRYGWKLEKETQLNRVRMREYVRSEGY